METFSVLFYLKQKWIKHGKHPSSFPALISDPVQSHEGCWRLLQLQFISPKHSLTAKGQFRVPNQPMEQIIGLWKEARVCVSSLVVECMLWDWKIVGSNPELSHTKHSKNWDPMASCLTLNVKGLDWGVKPPNGSRVWLCLQVSVLPRDRSNVENKFHTLKHASKWRKYKLDTKLKPKQPLCWEATVLTFTSLC